jgi:phosphoribosylanthranilate isomerase
MAEIKFCGMTRAEDALEAARLGASYVGVVFAAGPRRQTLAQARAVLAGLEAPVRRVGVFGGQSAAEIGDIATALELDVVQLHGDPSTQMMEEVRRVFRGHVWPVLRLAGQQMPPGVAGLFDAADAVVLDAFVAGELGGTGVALPWEALRTPLAMVRARGRLVLAGGLRPENVGRAILLLRPDVVDVSSGVESAPGVKDHARMRAFRDASETAQVNR